MSTEATVETLAPVQIAQREQDEAEEWLRALQAEAAGLRDAMREAARKMDAVRLTQLRRRGGELPALIFVAEATAKRKALAVLAAERAELEGHLREAMDELAHAAKRWQEAKDFEGQLRGEHGVLRAQTA